MTPAVKSKRKVKRIRDTLTGRKPRGQGHERLGEILNAAKELFVAEGYEAVSTRQLAEHAGLSQTGLYLYFKNKEEIHEALCSQTFEQLTRRLHKVAQEAAGPEDMLRRAARAYVDFGLEHPDEYQIAFMQRQPLDPSKTGDLFHPSRHKGPGVRAFLAWRDLITSVMKGGFIKPMDVTSATLMAWLPMHGLVAARIARPTFPWPPRHKLIETLIDTILTGLQVRR
jgi:AcrR family transcriptional regulator